MRISTQQIFDTALGGILQQQSRLNATQAQLATGQRVNRPSDDPAMAARIQELERAVARQDVYVDNVGRARHRLNVEESALVAVSETVRRARELTVQAASDPIGDESRRLIAVELRQRLEELLGAANRQDGDGEFIFAGTRSLTRPFARVDGEVVYLGDDIQRELSIAAGTTMPDGDTGDRVFMNILDGNGRIRAEQGAANTGTGVIRPEAVTAPAVWAGQALTLRFVDADTYEVLDAAANVLHTGTFSPGDQLEFAGVAVTVSGAPAAGDEFLIEPARRESLFATVAGLAAALEDSPADDASRARQRQAIDDALSRFDRIEDHLLQVRADVGARLNNLDSAEAGHEELKLGLQGLVSEIRDLDYAEAISRFQQQLTTLQAAQQSFTRIQNLSLFNFLR